MLFTDASYMPGRLTRCFSRCVGMNKMGLEQANKMILQKKIVVWVKSYFLGKKAILATARVSRANMIVKLGPELNYFGDSGANL